MPHLPVSADVCHPSPRLRIPADTHDAACVCAAEANISAILCVRNLAKVFPAIVVPSPANVVDFTLWPTSGHQRKGRVVRHNLLLEDAPDSIAKLADLSEGFGALATPVNRPIVAVAAKVGPWAVKPCQSARDRIIRHRLAKLLD